MFISSHSAKLCSLEDLESEPQTRAGPLLPFPSLLPFVTFLHWLQTSITRSFIKLESFLIPFIRTRRHDESAHTFGSSHWFLEVPQKGVLKKWFLAFFEQNVSSTFCHQTSSTCHTDTTQSGIWSDPPPDTILLSCYCTVLYCITLYCTVLHCTVLYLGALNPLR